MTDGLRKAVPEYISPNGTFVLSQDAAVVQTESGKLRGYIDGDTFTFLGVPYAVAGRYCEPQKVPAWEGVKNALVYGPVPPSYVFPYYEFMEVMTPHLYWPAAKDFQEPMIQNLNLWTQSLDETAKAPVIVMFHAGGLSSGSAVEQVGYHGKALSRFGNVVVVNVNIRLGVLGFLDLSAYGEKYRHSGNLGLMDFVSALNWVKDNISSFGGDPDNVTLFGHNIGQINLMEVPAAKGLFKRVVCLGSGSLLIPQEVSRRVAEETLKKLEIASENLDQILTVPYDQLNAAATFAYEKVGPEYPQFMQGLWPSLDGDFIPEDAFGDIDHSHRTEIAKDIPMILGINFAEGSSNLQGILEGTEPPLHSMSPEELDERLTKTFGSYKDRIVEVYRRIYPKKPLEDLIYFDANITFDEHYRGTLAGFPKVKADQNGAPVYRYMYSFEYPVMGGAMAWHTSEIAMCMNNYELMRSSFGNSAEVKAMSDLMTSYVVAFARTGDPNFEGAPEWKPYTTEGGFVLDWDIEPSELNQHDIDEMIELIEAARKEVGWKSIFDLADSE